MAARVLKISMLIMDAGECPMCGFDSLRKITGNHLTEHGVTTLFEQVYCGRCAHDLHDSLQ